MSEWKEYKLGEIYEVHNGLSKGREFFGSGYPFISFSTVFNKWFVPEKITDLAQTTESEQENYSIKAGDILVTRTSETADELGMSCVALKDVPHATYNGFCKRMRQYNPDIKVYPKYVGYYMRNPEFRKNFQTFAGSMSTRASLTNDALLGLTIALPPLEEQKRIAGILSSLDDKIELNNKINDNLEKQAQALFKNWFIDYAPFGGVMPEDWQETTLGDVCLKVTDGSHFSPQDDSSAPYPMYSVKDMETYGFNPNNCKHISAEDFEKMKAGDCVPKLDDVLVAKDGSYLKEIFICSEEREEAILSSIAIFRPNTKKILPEILLFLLKQPSVRKDVGDNFVSGSALPRIVLKDFKKYQFVLPSIESQQELAKMLNSIRMQIHNNVEETQRLTTLRDTLLPKLMC